jgi:predicted nucleic acid-binding protein
MPNHKMLLMKPKTRLFGIRAADLLHLAIATVLGASRFRTFDQHQARLAKRMVFD